MCVKSPEYRFLHFLAANRPNSARGFAKFPGGNKRKNCHNIKQRVKDKIGGELKLERGPGGARAVKCEDRRPINAEQIFLQKKFGLVGVTKR
jgi:hypothetical protein